jgi:5-methylthioadenosine/S-adenosylhomocysteine deaminase
MSSMNPGPGRGEYLLRGGYVLTVDARYGDLPAGDVHVRDGQIVGVGVGLEAPDATVIDAAGHIVLPGFVETHWHLWNSSLRGLVVDDDPDRQYFPVTVALGPSFTPEDTYCATRLGLVEAIGAGMTTVHDWSHNVRSPEHADASLRALRDSGLRGTFSYGWPQQSSLDSPIDLTGLIEIQRAWFADPPRADGLLRLGFASRNLVPGQSPRGSIPLAVAHEDWAGARSLGLPITLHASPAGLVELLDEEGLLGPDVLLVHPTLTTDAENATVAERGAAWSLSPIGEAARGPEQQMRFPELDRAGVRLGLSVDTTCTDTANMFAVMRVVKTMATNRLGEEGQVTCRRLIEVATLGGAEVLGIDDLVGSITPGKRADLILVDRAAPNMAPAGDPATQLVNLAQPTNVRTVMVDGRFVLRDRQFTTIDPAEAVGQASASAAAVCRRAGWSS